MSDEIQPRVPGGDLIVFQAEDGQTRVQCRFFNNNIWLSQALIADLFQITIPTANEHLKSIYSEGELPPRATIRKFRIVRREGARQVTREIYLREGEITELNRIVVMFLDFADDQARRRKQVFLR